MSDPDPTHVSNEAETPVTSSLDQPSPCVPSAPSGLVPSAPSGLVPDTLSLPIPHAPLEPFSPERSWLCCTTYKDRAKFMTILRELDLTPIQKEILEVRYLSLLQNLQKRTRNHAIIYFIGHFVITVGSLFVPALLSIQNSDREYALTGGAFNVHIYWSTFIISLLVTIWNAILTLFRIDKKYYFLNTILERLRSEGWQYMSLTGRYSGHLLEKGVTPTHANQFIHFTHFVEKMKMKQIEEEYYRTDEKAQAPTGSSTTSATALQGTGMSGHTVIVPGPGGNQVMVPMELYSPSPSHPIPSMSQAHVPEPIQTVYNAILQQQQGPPPSLLSSSGPSLYSSYSVPAPPVPSPSIPHAPKATKAPEPPLGYREMRKRQDQSYIRGTEI